ncbi:FMN-dependent dehydrogenase family protein [Exophiala viscosa]|uniref:FMN-dependent dehydrogenase family protein n=2 Tax=Exophiala viscosa TaxID=2486360 RepID=A0AAN6IB53_9EURO|nr:FMN-dependent dehydrogenase family protein [Exophiala viscosa]
MIINRGISFDPHVYTIADLQKAGSKNMEKSHREFVNEGAMDLITLRDNEEAYNRYKIRARVMKDVTNIDMSTTIWGKNVAFPFGFSPAAFHKLAHPDGEVGTSRATAELNVPMVLSNYANCSLEDVVAQRKQNPYGMQLTLVRDRDITLKTIKRAEKAGYDAIVLSIDGPVLGMRLNEYRNSFDLPDSMTCPNLEADDSDTMEGGSRRLEYEDNLDWANVIPWMKANTKLEIWMKGVHTPEDVALAIQHGLDGVIISNTGGRQLDGVPATLDSLRDCAPVAKGKIKIAVDGGIRRGSDVF